ncbi:MAG: class I SAM-dependent methyltransferase [Acetobacteraceae bacterium]|nr:class I SAM-dependent methyltransferase [Acetobacteraceae bacterium]
MMLAEPETGMVPGTEGYAAQAEALVAQYESIRFADLHGWMLDLLPTAPGSILDVGAGSGRDAAGFAAMGHRVLAVEPTAELRGRAQQLHPLDGIEWLDDALPDLDRVARRGVAFDVVMVTAVWMHLDEAERLRAMRHVSALVRPGGVLAMALRHGPIPAGRRMFDVGAEETIGLATEGGLTLARRLDEEPSLLGAAEVKWTRLAFRSRA